MESNNNNDNEQPKKVNKTWEALGRLKGALTILDPQLQLQAMRYMLDTNILVYAIMDRDYLSPDVKAILSDYDNTFYVSAESVKELIVLFRKKKIGSKIWKDAKELVRSLTDDYYLTVLPVDNEVMKTYAALTINEATEHNDPSDHIIVSHAITLRMPLISSDGKFEFYRKQGLELIFNEK